MKVDNLAVRYEHADEHVGAEGDGKGRQDGLCHFYVQTQDPTVAVCGHPEGVVASGKL